MKEREENAVRSLSDFLKAEGAGDGYKFSDVDIAGEFDYKELKYYILKYRKMPSDGKWFLGICGGFFEKEHWHCGYVSGSSEHYDEKDAEEKAVKLAEKLRLERVEKRRVSLLSVPLLAQADFNDLFSGPRRVNGILTGNLYLILEHLGNEGYLNAVLSLLSFGVEAGFYTRQELEEDLDSSLFSSYALININSADAYVESERLLCKTEYRGLKNPVWCYRYSISLMYNKRYLKSYEYALKCAEADIGYPWGYLQLARISYKLGKTEEALQAVAKGLEIVPGDYEFLTTKREIEAKRPFREMLSHYIDPQADSEPDKDKYIPDSECR